VVCSNVLGSKPALFHPRPHFAGMRWHVERRKQRIKSSCHCAIADHFLGMVMFLCMQDVISGINCYNHNLGSHLLSRIDWMPFR
jgi:hypothetical protein